MPCDYPHCVGGQNGTQCRDECKETQAACHGPCQQGRLPCPTPEACERPDVPSPAIPTLLLAIMLVFAVFVVLWVLS